MHVNEGEEEGKIIYPPSPVCFFFDFFFDEAEH